MMKKETLLRKSRKETLMLFGDLHCVPLDTTEVLTRNGWKYMRDLKNEQIMISNVNGDLFFDDQELIIKENPEEVIKVSNVANFDFESTIYHRNLVKSRTTGNKELTTESLLNHSQIRYLTAGNLVTDFKVSNKELDLAYIAGFMLGDGTWDNPWKISVKKQRKIDILSKMGDYLTNCPQKNGYTVFRLKSAYNAFIDNLFGYDKKINWESIFELNYSQINNFLEGLIAADGCVRKDGRKTIRLASIHKEHVELYQTLGVLTGKSVRQGSIKDNKNSTFPSDKPLYSANLRPREYTCVSKTTRTVNKRVTNVGCVNVSTGFFLAKQNGQIIITGNCPYHHKDSLSFLKEVKRKYKPTEIICTGDEVDKHAMSFHDSDPDLPSAGDELKLAIKDMKKLYKLFPNCTVLDSNHGSMLYRKGKHHGIPRKYLRDYNEILEAPNGWNWVNSYKADMGNGQKLFVTHGLEKNSGRFARNMGMCVAQGHYHTDFGIEYSSTPENLIWGASVGCLIDKQSLAFAYDKANLKRPILGCLIVQNGVPKSIPMVLDKSGNWDGNVE